MECHVADLRGSIDGPWDSLEYDMDQFSIKVVLARKTFGNMVEIE